MKLKTMAVIACLLALSACQGGTTASTTTTNASLSGAVVDGRVNGATLTVYSDQAMTNQVGTGSTDSTGAFNITLTVTTAPDPVYIKSTGGTDIDTGLAAPTMSFVANTTGANALTTFNITPLTDHVFKNVLNGDTLTTAQTNAQTTFGLTANTGTGGLYGDPSADTSLQAAEFKKLTSGTVGATIKAGSYKLFAVVMSENDQNTTTLSNIASVTGGNNFVTGNITVDANGVVSGTASTMNVTGKVVGSSILFNLVDNVTTPTTLTRVVGNIGLNGSIAGNYTDMSNLTTTPVMKKGIFVASVIPATGVNAAGLATFINNYYSPSTTTTSGRMNIVARDLFIPSANYIPRFFWGQVDAQAVDMTAGTLTMGNMTMRGEQGSIANTGTNTYNFQEGVYIKSGGVPTNLVAFRSRTTMLVNQAVPAAGTVTMDLYVITSIGLRRGIYITVPISTTSATTFNFNKVFSIGECYMSKANSTAPTGFTAGATNEITVASINAGMLGSTRSTALTQGLAPSSAGTLALPGNFTVGNAYLDTNTTGVSELMVSQGGMFAMKSDANDNFTDTTDHMRLVEFYESGAMQGEEIWGGNIPTTTTPYRTYPGNFVGFVRNQASTTTPSFTGTLNILARTMYANTYSTFSNAYTYGTVTVATAPTTAATGAGTLSFTTANGSTGTVALTIDKLTANVLGVYHFSGSMPAAIGGGTIDISWPVGGTKALYALSNTTGNIDEIGEAYITQ